MERSRLRHKCGAGLVARGRPRLPGGEARRVPAVGLGPRRVRHRLPDRLPPPSSRSTAPCGAPPPHRSTAWSWGGSASASTTPPARASALGARHRLLALDPARARAVAALPLQPRARPGRGRVRRQRHAAGAARTPAHGLRARDRGRDRGAPGDLCKGLTLVTGCAGGPANPPLLAAGTRRLLERGAGRIQSYEAPIEYVFDGIATDTALMSSAEIPRHFSSFADGLRSSLRRRPAAVIVGRGARPRDRRGGGARGGLRQSPCSPPPTRSGWRRRCGECWRSSPRMSARSGAPR